MDIKILMKGYYMWKLLHKLFGYDYVAYKFAGEYEVAKIDVIETGVFIDSCYIGYVKLSVEPDGTISGGGRPITPVTISEENLRTLILANNA